MKLQVTASSSPRAAAVRRTLRSASWARVAVGLATPGARSSGVDGTCVVAGDPRDFLDQVGRALRRHAATSGRSRHCRLSSKPRLSRISRWRCSGTSIPPSALVRAKSNVIVRCSTGGSPARTLAPTASPPQMSRISPVRIARPSSRKAGSTPRSKRRAGVAGQAQRLAGARDPLGREISDFEHHVGGRLADARILAAHDPADVVHLRVVGDHRHERLEAHIPSR